MTTSVPTAATRIRKRTGKLGARTRRFGLMCFAPSLVLVIALILYPFLYTVALSFQRRQLFEKEGSFVGLANYQALLTSADFWSSTWNGVVFSLGSLLFQVVLGVALAVLLNRPFKGRGLFRGLLLFPYLIPSIVGVFAIRWMLNDLYGIVNYWLIALGVVKEAIPWFGKPGLAMASLIAVNTWMFYPFVMLCVLARLQSIPPDLYEAARIDGAGEWAQFWHVTLPQLRGTLAVVVIVRAMWMFNKFDTVWLTTQGGPFGSTQTLPVLAYTEAFSLYEIGRASAMGILMSAMLFAVFILYQRVGLRVQRWQ